jgi:serine/threonine-protein kinase RsbT
VTYTWETEIAHPVDIERARQQVRRHTRVLGFGLVAVESVTLATMELGSNLLRYATQGSLWIADIENEGRVGILVESRDLGPGISDVSRALTDGYSTSGGLGSGLPAVRRLMDSFSLETGPEGTTISACKWLP